MAQKSFILYLHVAYIQLINSTIHSLSNTLILSHHDRTLSEGSLLAFPIRLLSVEIFVSWKIKVIFFLALGGDKDSNARGMATGWSWEC